jgi:hypothetical protein
MQHTPELYVVCGFSILLLGIIALIRPYDFRGLTISKRFPHLSVFGLVHGPRNGSIPVSWGAP